MSEQNTFVAYFYISLVTAASCVSAIPAEVTGSSLLKRRLDETMWRMSIGQIVSSAVEVSHANYTVLNIS